MLTNGYRATHFLGILHFLKFSLNFLSKPGRHCFVIISLIGCNMWHAIIINLRKKDNMWCSPGFHTRSPVFLLNINDLANVSSNCFSILFADGTNMFISGRNLDVLCNQVNEDLQEIQEWLSCNKFSLNVLKTHDMIFTPRNKKIEDIDIQLYGVDIRVFVTKFLGVQIDCNLSWKCHIEYTCKKLSTCVGILCKARTK